MKIRVKLKGVLVRSFPESIQSNEFNVEIPDGSLVKDLIKHLDISDSVPLVITKEDKILTRIDFLQDKDSLVFMRAFQGG